MSSSTPSTSCNFKKARHAWQVKNLNQFQCEQTESQMQAQEPSSVQTDTTSNILSNVSSSKFDENAYIEMETEMDLDESSNESCSDGRLAEDNITVQKGHMTEDQFGSRSLKRKVGVITVVKDEGGEKKTRLQAQDEDLSRTAPVSVDSGDGPCPDCARLHQEGAEFLNTARQNFTQMVSTQCLRRECASQHCFSSSTQVAPNTAARPHHFLQQWQNQHIAKAMVDNTINKTLEDMGWSPSVIRDPVTDRFSRQRSRVVNAGVSEAIRACGLRRQTEDSLYRLNPLVSTLTHMSESILTRRSCFRSFYNNNQTSNSLDSSGNYVQSVSDSDESSINDNDIDNADILASRKMHVDTCLTNETICNAESVVGDIPSPGFNEPCSTDLIDQAVTAAISEKGLSIL